jgi:hypothetical protein
MIRRHMLDAHNRPCAAPGLTSYRYLSPYNSWVMIGAKDPDDALREAMRSVTGPVSPDRLQVWDGKTYVRVSP